MNIVFSDVDGTFQGLGVDVPAINIEAVKALQAQGDQFVFVTGRGYGLVKQMEEDFSLDCDIIFGNGAGLKRMGQPATFGSTLSLDVCERVVAVLEELEVLYFIHTDTDIIIRPLVNYQKQLAAVRQKLEAITPDGKAISDYKEAFFETECLHQEDLIAYLAAHPERRIVKVELMEADDDKQLLLRKRLADEEVCVFNSFVQTLEIVHPLSTKGAAIQAYMKEYTGATSYGIGDGENDVAMLEVVDVPIAVANASEHIKGLAKKVIDSCENGGVGKFIEAELLHKESQK